MNKISTLVKLVQVLNNWYTNDRSIMHTWKLDKGANKAIQK